MFEIGSSVAIAIVIGFAFSGIAVSSYTLITDSRLKFEQAAADDGLVWSKIALLFWSGPHILVRNSLKAAFLGLRPRYWLVLSALVASSWSFCTGLVILNLVTIMRNTGF